MPLLAQNDPAQLANQLTASCKTDREKVKAIFKWITENISYRTFVRQKKITHTNKIQPDEPEDTNELKPLNERVAEMVLKEDGQPAMVIQDCSLHFVIMQASVVS